MRSNKVSTLVVMSKQKTAITPTRSENYPLWYQAVIQAADLAESSSVRGCMVIKPWGYALWEAIQYNLNARLKATGHENIYCPMLIPLSHLEREAKHIRGFAKECAVVTHTRLKEQEGKLMLDAELTEPLVVRPTSETVIGERFAQWIQSYRDLPLLINQWANIVRWEMRPRLFLRTSEFLWQEGHTAHATEQEAKAETLNMLDVYQIFVEKMLAIPVIVGEKTALERFPGAVKTYCIEAMMQDRKALQAGTSHFFGQHFSKAFNIQFTDHNEAMQYAWTTSFGVSTRLIGALIMSHSDDDGLILPPRIAPIHIVILPILHDETQRTAILNYCEKAKQTLQAIQYHGQKLQVHLDRRDRRGGEKNWAWIKKGVPIRLEIGAKETAQQTLTLKCRDHPHKQAQTIPYQAITEETGKTITETLDRIQTYLWHRAHTRLTTQTKTISHQDDFYAYFKGEHAPGFAKLRWHPDNSALEKELKQAHGISIRCLIKQRDPKPCLFTQTLSDYDAVFAKAY